MVRAGVGKSVLRWGRNGMNKTKSKNVTPELDVSYSPLQKGEYIGYRVFFRATPASDSISVQLTKCTLHIVTTSTERCFMIRSFICSDVIFDRNRSTVIFFQRKFARHLHLLFYQFIPQVRC
jgi:hypothetical protein